MSDAIVRCEGVTKRFGRVKALNGLTFSVSRGEIFGLIGPNGCGKTTTVRTLLGFYRSDAGTVRVFGRDPRNDFDTVGRHIGVILEQPGLFGHLNPVEYLEVYGGLFGLPRSIASRRAVELLGLVGMRPHARRQLRRFSKGMAQRVCFARALLNHPQLLILDEPFDGIDIEARRELTDLLPSIAHGEGTGVLVTSHNLTELEKVSDCVAIMRDGHIVALDSPAALRQRFARPNTLVITLAHAPPSDQVARSVPEGAYDAARRQIVVDLAASNLSRDALLRRLVEHQLSVATITEAQTTLEDVYFSLTRGGEEP